MTTELRYVAGQVVDGRTICGAKRKNFDPCEASPLKGQPDVSVMAMQAPSDGRGGSSPQCAGNEVA